MSSLTYPFRNLPPPPLACTVRDCGLPLERNALAFVCARGHSYDIARAGYVNLLQPQDRRSLAAGDSIAAVEARARLLAAGVGRAPIDYLLQYLTSLHLPDDAAIADLGSGSGDALAACVAEREVTGIGIDLSTAAVRHAAHKFPELTWIVANADRRLPIVGSRLSLVLSLHGRRNPSECARVLAPTGRLFVAVPAADDLVELRTLLHGKPVERSRVEALTADYEPLFELVERFSSREQHTLNRESLVDLLQSTYRGARASVHRHVASLSTMDVTLSSDCVVFAPRARARVSGVREDDPLAT
jgi:23S rRNA (guanine745-N1)-methyltransferase